MSGWNICKHCGKSYGRWISHASCVAAMKASGDPHFKVRKTPSETKVRATKALYTPLGA